jgi:hypothetical protein
MPEKIEELEVGRHVKMRSKAGGIDVHCSDTICGAWLTKGRKSIGIVSERDMVYVCLYDDQNAQKLPVALTTKGIQIPDENGKPEFFEWSKLAEVLRK